MKFEKPEAIDKPKKGEEEVSEKKFPLPFLIGGVVIVVVAVVAAGFLTGTFQKIFNHEEAVEEIVITSDDQKRNNSSLTKNAFGLGLEDTEAGVKMVCETEKDDNGIEQRICRAKTAEEKKAEEEEAKKKKEEEETKKKQEEELKEANKKKETTNNTTENPTEETTKRTSIRDEVPVTALTDVSGCPEKLMVGETATLTSTVMPWNASDPEIFWLQSDYESIDVKQPENGIAEVTAKKANKPGEFVIVSAISSANNKASKSCKITVVSELE